MIVKNRLLNYDNFYIYQDNDAFLFSLDSVLLTNFVTIKLSDKKIIDLCCGNAPIPMLLTKRTKARIFGVELQKDIYELGLKSIIENKVQEQIELFNYDVRDIEKLFEEEFFDVLTCNPPYFKYKDGSLVNENKSKMIARHEVCLKLEDIVSKAKYLLKNGGTFALVHRPDRLMEIINVLNKYCFQVKKIRFVYPKINKDSNIVLIEAIKNGKVGLKIEKPLVVYDENNEYCEEIKEMFNN